MSFLKLPVFLTYLPCAMCYPCTKYAKLPINRSSLLCPIGRIVTVSKLFWYQHHLKTLNLKKNSWASSKVFPFLHYYKISKQDKVSIFIFIFFILFIFIYYIVFIIAVCTFGNGFSMCTRCDLYSEMFLICTVVYSDNLLCIQISYLTPLHLAFMSLLEVHNISKKFTCVGRI